jgi:hypothetical protein
VIDLTDALSSDETICTDAPLFVMETESDGSLTGKILSNVTIDETGKKITVAEADKSTAAGTTVSVDYYVIRKAKVTEMQIDGSNFAGYYYVEADTLFRKQENGRDMPAVLTFPNVKIQSNFTFAMASTGDPSTFTFTMDAFPGYTYFDKRKKVLAVM